MNVSSLVVSTLPENTEKVVEEIKAGGLCEYHLHKEGKIVVTIEAESVSDEIKVLNLLQQMEDVINAEMIYSYCEDELDKERDHLEIEGKFHRG